MKFIDCLLADVSLANLNEFQYAVIRASLRKFAEEAYQEYKKVSNKNK